MGFTSATVNGWRTRTRKTWYPTAGGFVSCSKAITGANCVASCPTASDGNYSNNMYTTIIKITTPTDASVGKITSISIVIHPYDVTTDSTYLYGSLRTVDDSTSAQNSISDYRTYVAGGSAEAYCIPDTLPSDITMTFNGNFSKGTSYYLWLYSKSTDDRFQLNASSTSYTCTVTYDDSVTITFSAGIGSGNVPSSISGSPGEYFMIGSERPTPPPNSDPVNTNFSITAYNNGSVFGTHNATKSVYTTYEFAGTFKAPNGNFSYSGGGIYLPNESTTYTAEYTTNQVTTYSNNTLADVKRTIGTPTKASTTANIPVLLDATTNGGTSITTSVNAKQTSTYTFKGWYTNSASSDVFSDNYTFTSSTIIYAIYNINKSTSTVSLPTSGVSKAPATVSTYTITLNPGSGTVSPTNVTASITKSYKFLGWATSPTGTSYITSYTPSSSNITLYAIFDSGTNTNNSATLPTPTRSGYAFLGWSTTNGGTSYVNTTYMPSSNITLYANYKTSSSVEMYIWNNGAWRRAKGHLCAQGILFNECVNA